MFLLLSFPFLSFPFLSSCFLSFPFLSFPFLSFPFLYLFLNQFFLFPCNSIYSQFQLHPHAAPRDCAELSLNPDLFLSRARFEFLSVYFPSLISPISPHCIPTRRFLCFCYADSGLCTRTRSTTTSVPYLYLPSFLAINLSCMGHSVHSMM